MKSGDKFRSRSALLAIAAFFFVPTQMHGKNSPPLQDILLLMDTMHSHTKGSGRRRENEMLVKHEFSAKTDARQKKIIIRNSSHVHDMWRGDKKKTELLPFVPLFFSKTLFTSN